MFSLFIMKKEVSIIFPVHNGSKYLEKSVNAVEAYLWSNGFQKFEIVIAEDGSTDGSANIAKKLSSERNNVLVLSSEERLGRGAALEQAIRHCTSEKIVYFDIDLATGLKSLKRTIDLLNSCDLVIGSRYLPDSQAKRTFVRRFLSIGYRSLVNVFFGAKITDYQCGFKGFRKSSIQPILKNITDKKWFWDTILILEATSKKQKIKEVPVNWEEAKDSTVDIFTDSLEMFFALCKYKLVKLGLFPNHAEYRSSQRH